MLENKVCVVTGGSRGVGRGIALALGALGATVYITGRTQKEGEAALPGTIHGTAEEITARGGKGIALACDHADDAQVAAAFERIAGDHGRIDILVNNAFIVPDGLVEPGPFWSKPLALTRMLEVGLRSSYVSSYQAHTGRQHGSALVVNTSSFGGTCYMHGPAYGAGKAAVDKMAHDMAVDFKPYNVAAVSIWMGLLLTERTEKVVAAEPEKYGGLADSAESPEFTGRVIAALADDPDLMSRSGKIWVGAELAAEYGVVDINGRQPASHRPMLGNPPSFSDAVVE